MRGRQRSQRDEGRGESRVAGGGHGESTERMQAAVRAKSLPTDSHQGHADPSSTTTRNQVGQPTT